MPGVIQDIQDGSVFANHAMFSNKSKLTIALQLFTRMGTTNPLRGQSVMYNVGVFYFTVKNIPKAYNSCFANVHLLAKTWLCVTSMS